MKKIIEQAMSQALGSKYVNCFISNLSILLYLNDIKPQWLFGGLIDDVSLLSPQYSDRQIYLAEYLQLVTGGYDHHWLNYECDNADSLVAHALRYRGDMLVISLPMTCVHYRDDIGVSTEVDKQLKTQHSFCLIEQNRQLILFDATQGNTHAYFLDNKPDFQQLDFPFSGYQLDVTAFLNDLRDEHVLKINQAIINALKYCREHGEQLIQAKANLVERVVEQQPGSHLFSGNHFYYVNLHRRFVLLGELNENKSSSETHKGGIYKNAIHKDSVVLIDAIEKISLQINAQFLRYYLLQSTSAAARKKIRELVAAVCDLEMQFHQAFNWDAQSEKYV